MIKRKSNVNIDWQSKIIDLLIVIVGITIAFKLNTWNESRKTDSKSQNYLENFQEENNANLANLVSALEFSELIEEDIDSLQQILLSKNYTDKRIETLSSSMMGLASFNPSTTTMENIMASGEFELIKNIELRKNIISTYNAYKTTKQLEQLLTDYVNTYLTPYFIDNVRFKDFSSIHSNYIEDPKFENMIIGYGVLLDQQIKGYQNNLEKVKQLNEKLN